MKVILSIEVPDDFTKGNCHECPLSYSPDDWDWSDKCVLMRGYRDCPLEIQDSEQEVVPFCKSCKHNSNCQEWVNSYGCGYEPIGE